MSSGVRISGARSEAQSSMCGDTNGANSLSDKETVMAIVEILLLIACLLYLFGDEVQVPPRA